MRHESQRLATVELLPENPPASTEAAVASEVASPILEPLRGRVTLERASVQLLPLAPPALVEVSLDVAPGRFVAVVGPSGSGKSILASLLVGLFQPSSGRVLFDGASLERLDYHWVQRQTGVVPQRPHLLPTTVRANVALSEPALPLESLVEAARAAGALDEIAALPRGWDTLLADCGLSLGDGLRQRLALARALVARPAVLLLDEALAAPEHDEDARLAEALRSLSCTRIVLARRRATMAAADEILVVREGRIVERGAHGELLSVGGHYARLLGLAASDPWI